MDSYLVISRESGRVRNVIDGQIEWPGCDVVLVDETNDHVRKGAFRQLDGTFFDHRDALDVDPDPDPEVLA